MNKTSKIFKSLKFYYALLQTFIFFEAVNLLIVASYAVSRHGLNFYEIKQGYYYPFILTTILVFMFSFVFVFFGFYRTFQFEELNKLGKIGRKQIEEINQQDYTLINKFNFVETYWKNRTWVYLFTVLIVLLTLVVLAFSQ